jgi:voltage-gated potassium channel
MASWGLLVCHYARRVDLRGVIDYLGPPRPETGDERGCTSVQKLTVDRLPRFGFLLAAMVAEIVVGPFIVMVTQSLTTVRLLAAVVLLAALSVAGSRRIAVTLFAIALAAHFLSIISPRTDIAALSEAARLVFLCYVLVLLVRRVMRDRVVSLDTVAGAACAYMLIGWVWGELFTLVEGWRPGSFIIPAGWLTGAGHDLRATLMYFSFATLTTVGYGDIHPGSPAAGMLCAAEALVGQLYLAIMIARTVGLHTAQRST